MAEDACERVRETIEILRARYPEVKVSLEFESPFQLLVATILAAQCTDSKVNEVTPALFDKYPTPAALASADPSEVEELIHATGFFRQKSRAIIEASQDIVNEYGGQVPDMMEDLTTLRGVGRKTANVLLGAAFGKPVLIVDTHVIRISARLGLVDQKLAEKKDADKIEQQLLRVVPEEDQTLFSNLLVHFGRDICTAKKPLHEVCPLLHLCPTGQAAVAGQTAG